MLIRHFRRVKRGTEAELDTKVNKKWIIEI